MGMTVDEMINNIREVQLILMSTVDCFENNHFAVINKINTKLELIARELEAEDEK